MARNRNIKEKLIQKNVSITTSQKIKTNSETKTGSENLTKKENYMAEPCEDPNSSICIDWYWQTYDEITGTVIYEEYLYSSCYNTCNNTNTGGSTSPSDLYICGSSFKFLSQGTNSITNVSNTWGIKAGYITSQGTFGVTFGMTTYAPTDVINWGDAWSYLNLNFYYLIQSGDVWTRPDTQGGIHLMYSSYAQSEIAAAATDWASDNDRNPKDVLVDPIHGKTTYKTTFRTLFTEYMKAYIPGTTTQLINSPITGITQATYSTTPNCH